MPHLDDDRLILRALDDEPLTDTETGHLDGCTHCHAELDRLRQLVGAGRHTHGLQALPAPPPRVWDRIQAELAATGRAEAPPPVTLQTAPPPLRLAPAPPAARNPAPIGDLRARRRGPGWAMTAAVAAAAAAIAAAVTLAVTRPPAPAAQAQPCAGVPQVRLEALPGVPAGVTGYACLRTSDGQRHLHIHAEGMPSEPDGDYEAWLLDATSLNGPSLRMEALGVLGTTTDQELPVPANLDLGAYRIVDISAEPHDGNAAHSGHSLLRGTLH